MSEQNYAIDRDLREARELVEAFVPYIYGDELYGRATMNGPMLTPGAILLRLKRLQALRGQMNTAQNNAFEEIESRFATSSREWNTHFQKKLVREAEARLRDVQTYLSECKDDPKICASSYLPEAMRRTMVQIIMDELPQSEQDELKTKVKNADNGLRRYVEDTDFIWADSLKAVYPRDTFWWLYSRPPYPDKK